MTLSSGNDAAMMIAQAIGPHVAVQHCDNPKKKRSLRKNVTNMGSPRDAAASPVCKPLNKKCRHPQLFLDFIPSVGPCAAVRYFSGPLLSLRRLRAGRECFRRAREVLDVRDARWLRAFAVLLYAQNKK